MASSKVSSSSNSFSSAVDPTPPPASTLVLNIHSHVPVTLSADEGNFRQWRFFFELTFKKFGLVSHVDADGTVDAATMFDDPEWLQIDSCIVSWLCSAVSKEISNDVYEPRNNAYTAWTAVTAGFSRTVYSAPSMRSRSSAASSKMTCP